MYIQLISLWFYSNFEREHSLDMEFNFASNEYSHCIFFMDTTPQQKMRNTLKNMSQVGFGIQFRIQRVPALHTFDGPRYPKNKKYLKKCDDDIMIITFFKVFLVFGVAGSIKSMRCGYSLDAESNSASKELSQSKFE